MTGTDDVATLIAKGFAAYQARDVGAARECYQRALEVEPDNAEAWRLLGLAEIDRDLAEAARLIEKAVAINPDEPLYRRDLSAVYEKLGNNELALANLRALLAVAGGDPRAWTRLWRLERRLGKAGAAIEAFTRALMLVRANAGALRRLGEKALTAGDPDCAVRAAEFLIMLPGAERDAFRLACAALVMQRRWRDLAKSAGDWSARYGDDARAWRCLSMAQFELGLFRTAAESFEEVLRLEGDCVANRVAYGRLRAAAHDFAVAESVLEACVSEDEESADAKAALSHLLTLTGDVARAESLARAAIAVAPQSPSGYIALADAAPAALEDSHLAAMEPTLSQPCEHRIRLHFARGAAFEARGEFEAAFKAFEAGSALKRDICRLEGAGYDSAQQTAHTDRLIELSARPPAAGDRAARNFTPVFIVSMPRAGSTLVESILAAHPDVHGGGELLEMPLLLEEAMA